MKSNGDGVGDEKGRATDRAVYQDGHEEEAWS